ncbi:MAG: lipopolysaccharide biosynthesis protein [Bacteroidaceae bacterium]|nr:lipopolysaccharide biosynthesis protein [Bacteroidaceae bacterium]
MHSDHQTGNKKIVKNTLVVYGQLFLKMLLGLYTSRLALEALGVSDYGLNSVVGGIVVLFTFISDSLAGTTIRFINVERGKEDGNLNHIFNVCNVLHIITAFSILLLLEIGGVFYINNFLNVDAAKAFDAMFVFQVSTIVCCIGIVNVPYSSLFNATEKFLFTAIVEISVKVVQLGLLFWLQTFDGNRLKAFSLIETLPMLTAFVVYHIYCYRHWREVVKWRIVKDRHLYRETLSYSYYNLMSTVAYMFRGQGSLLLINYFFGTIVNGAYAVAKTVNRSISPFANNFLNAAAPQITQSYSRGDMERVYYLTSRIGKYSLLMMITAFFPMWAELDFILHVWLLQVPDGALVFTQMILLMAFVAVTDGGISYVANASGKVSWFRIIYSAITISCIPIGYALFKMGYPAYVLLLAFIIADILWRIIQFCMAYIILHFPVIRFCQDVFIPITKVCIPIIICLSFTSRMRIDNLLLHLGHLALILTLTLASAFFIGLNKIERKQLLTWVRNFTKGIETERH